MKTIILSLFLIPSFVISQDIHFSQYNTMNTYVNPAFAGTSGGIRFANSYRDQWRKVAAPYKTYGFSYDQYLKSFHGGIGVNYYHDNAGDAKLKTNEVVLIYSFHISLKKIVIAPALQIGLVSKTINYSNLTWGNQYVNGSYQSTNPTNEPTGNSKFSYLDFSSGVMFYGKRFYTGVSLFHLNNPRQSFYSSTADKLYSKLVLNGGYILKSDSSSKFSLSPTLLYAKQGPSGELVPGVTAKYSYFLLGVSYRTKDAVIFCAGFQNSFLRIGYSFDYTISSLSDVSVIGGHEVSLVLWLIKNKDDKKLFLKPIAF